MFRIEIDREVDGRWIGEVPAIPGVMAYGATEAEARNRTEALALRVMADRIEHGEPVPPEARELAPPPLGPARFSRRSTASGGTSNDKPDHTAHWSARAGGTTCSPSTRARKLGRVCWRGLPSTLAFGPTIFRRDESPAC